MEWLEIIFVLFNRNCFLSSIFASFFDWNFNPNSSSILDKCNLYIDMPINVNYRLFT